MKTLHLNTAKEYQTLDNFGASACWWTDFVFEHYPQDKLEEIARLLFDRRTGAGLSCIRFNIGAGSLWYDREFIENWMMRSGCFQHGPNAPYDWSQHAGQQWLLKKAKEMGVERSIAFLNSPPAWLTVNGHTRAGKSTGTTNLKYGCEKELAEFICGVLRHFAEAGLPFDYISPVNEPQVPWDDAKQEGCRYSNEDIVRTVLALSAELKKDNLDTRILLSESNTLLSLIDLDIIRPYIANFPDVNIHSGWQFGGKYCELIKDVFDLPVIREAAAPLIAGHSYGTDLPGVMAPARKLTAETMQRYPGYDYWMSEFCILGDYGNGRDLGIGPALYISRVIHSDLTLLNAAAWQWWLAVSGADYKDGLVYVDLDEEGHTGGVYASKMLWAIAHYARFLRPGSKRVELSGTDYEEGVLASAYRNTEGRLVIVVTNTRDTDETVQFTGLEAGRLSGFRTSAREDMAAIGTVDAGAPVVLKAQSILTLCE